LSLIGKGAGRVSHGRLGRVERGLLFGHLAGESVVDGLEYR